MDNKITKERINRHLEYDWFKYVLIFLAVAVVWISVYSIINNPTATQTIEISAVSPAVFSNGEQKYFEALDKRLQNENDKVIAKKSLSPLAPDLQGFGEVLLTRFMSSDIMIIPDWLVESYGGYFLELTDDIILQYFSQDIIGYELEYYCDPQSGQRTMFKAQSIKNLGTQLFSLSTFSDPSGSEEIFGKEYFVGIIRTSTNIGQYSSSKKGLPQNIQAFWALQEMFRAFG